MKKFKLEISCNTAAFGDRPELHLSDILHGIANTMRYISAIDNDRPIKTPVADVNGIQCGKWELREDASANSNQK